LSVGFPKLVGIVERTIVFLMVRKFDRVAARYWPVRLNA
jgi:hypothetical protein